jgi:HAD superfamily hydrolase (TIGR01549 family)
MINSNIPIKHISFDLDGTITDSFSTIYKTTCKTLELMKIYEPFPENEFRKRIGHHFIDIFREMSIPVKDFNAFIAIYKNHYFDFMGESILYPSVKETLEFLHQKDILISLLTTKQQDQAERIIDHFKLRKYFHFVMGRRNGIANKPSAEPLLFICKELNTRVENTLMVGDTELDVQFGKNAVAKSCAVLYGYREKESLINENPDFIIQKFDNLKKIIFKTMKEFRRA